MNKISAHITDIFKHNGCVLLQMQCAFGTLHSLVLEPCEFEMSDKVIVSFKENEIIPLYATPHTQHTLSMLNTFEAKVTAIQTSGFFTRLSLISTTQNTPDSTLIYALFPSLAPIELTQNQTCKWHIPSSHILLERQV